MSVSGGPAQYEIRVAGVLDSRWAAWFNGFQISGQGEETVICGLLADQPALHGLLTKVRDLGLCLISVRRLDGLANLEEDATEFAGPDGDQIGYEVTGLTSAAAESWHATGVGPG